MREMKHKYLVCDCGTPDHVVRVTLDTIGNEPELSIEPFLNINLPWYKRVWIGIRYMLGIRTQDKCGWGSYHFDTVLLNKANVNKLRRILNMYKVYEELSRLNKGGATQSGDGSRLENG